MKKKVVLVGALLIALVCVLSSCNNRRQASDGKIKAILITMDSMDEHWLKVKAGAEAKAAELGNVNLTFNAPPGKVDAAIQLQMVEDAITQKVDILLLAPLHAEALVPGVEKAKKAGIKVVLVDTGVNSDAFDAILATDNGAAARLAANELAKAIGEKGKIAIINAQAGAGTTMTRENDFKDEIAKKYPNITIVGTQYSDGDKTRALNIATDFMTANPDLVGIYGANEGSSTGGATGVEQAGKKGTIKFVGFDYSADIKGLIERDVMQATMVQNPYEMGYQGLQVGVDLLAGKTVNRSIDTGVTVATKANLNTIK
ncbi:ABC transporter substrate-binding protein [Treponema primitia]|uniref:ABC transporter substrate-binding protein n=1 Tax=Treponema primitia TaxID=88058 RepID=UPI0039810B02